MSNLLKTESEISAQGLGTSFSFFPKSPNGYLRNRTAKPKSVMAQNMGNTRHIVMRHVLSI
jgi:hypothetical protein